MHNYILSDTSCLILFQKIRELDLLRKVYSEIIITPEVLKEYGETVPDWIKIQTVKDKKKQKEFEKLVDLGEASVIALALELKNSVLIIDDKKGRNLAAKLQINITGTLGTLLKAKQKRIIPQIKPILKKLKEVDYRISETIEQGILKKAGE